MRSLPGCAEHAKPLAVSPGRHSPPAARTGYVVVNIGKLVWASALATSLAAAPVRSQSGTNHAEQLRRGVLEPRVRVQERHQTHDT